MTQSSNTADREIRATRRFAAPRDIVFQTWSSPEHLDRWWGPRGFTTTTQAMDFRPGGTWRYLMHGPDGSEYQNRITYLEIDEPNRIVYDHGDGNDPALFRVTVDFRVHDEGTELEMCMVFPTTEERDEVVEKYGAADGLMQTLDRLGEHLKTV